MLASNLGVLNGAIAALTAGHGHVAEDLDDAVLPRTGDPILAGPRGFAYSCSRCEVMGFVLACEPRTCWSCGEADALTAR